MNRQTIFVSAFPKSGSTFLTRLLGDVLNSPTGGCMPSEDDKEVATEGQDRPGPYIVRKGHFVLIDDDTGAVVPSPHRLAWKCLTDEKIVFLVRDPRDICVSGAWHWRQPVDVFLDRMIKGDVARCGRWDDFVKNAIDDYVSFTTLRERLILTTYESLLEDTFVELGQIVIGINRDFTKNNKPDVLHQAIKRNSFASRKAKIWATHRSYRPSEPDNVEKELRRNNMRKGIVGDWRNHFTPEMNDKIWSEFGWMMERLGYEKK